MIEVHLPRDLAREVGAEAVIAAPPQATLGELLRALEQSHPGLLRRITEPGGSLRPHINVFIGERLARGAEGPALPLADRDEVWVIRAISGG